MIEAERVLTELAVIYHRPQFARIDSLAAVRNLTAPYLPKPEPDRLTVAAIACIDAIDDVEGDDTLETIRAIIAREVAAAEPSDRVIERVISVICENSFRDYYEIRAALKREGA